MDTFQRLNKILLKTYPIDPATLTPERRLDELGIDSLGAGLLFFDVEDEFKIKFTQDPGQLQTVGDVVSLVDRVIAEQRGAAKQAAPTISSAL